jgi:hypothetical protein
MNGHVIALRDSVYNGLHVTEIQARMEALRVEIQSQVHKVDIASPFSIPKETSLNSVSASQQTEFGCSNSSTLMTRNGRWIARRR